MSTWTDITDNMVDLDSPATQSLMTAYRDNCIAIAEGEDANAPKVRVSNQDWDTNTSNPTASQRNWILNRLKGASGGNVGITVMAKPFWDQPGYVAPFNANAPGSDLTPCAADGTTGATSSLSGTYKCLGNGKHDVAGLWLRIA